MINTEKQTQPFDHLLRWADEIINATGKGGHPHFPSLKNKVYMRYLPDEDDESSGEKAVINEVFQPGVFMTGPTAFTSVVVELVLRRFEYANHENAVDFATQFEESVINIEENEHWVVEPLRDEEVEALHSFFHDAMERLAQRNEWISDIEYWEEQDKILARRLLLALSYVLAWQKYRVCVGFLCSMATPWIAQMDEVLHEAINDDDLILIRNALFCTRRRYLHFEKTVHGFDENVYGFDSSSDIPESTEDESRFLDESE